VEDYKVNIKKFQIPLLILFFGILVFILLLVQVIPKLVSVVKLENDTKTESVALADAERKLENLNNEAKEKVEESNSSLKAFYKPVNEGLDSEAAIAEEFAEILQVMRDNKIKTRAIKYDYDLQNEDNFVKNLPNKFHVCRITSDMIGTYTQFESFLRDLYRHEHFLDISTIKIVPYDKDKKILLVSLQLKLYAQNNGYVPPAPVQQAQEEQAAPASFTPPSNNDENNLENF